MPVPELSETRFKEILRAHLTPARAVSDPEHLKGRASMMRQIDRAFNSPGKHIFIYGDRGVGKTSLAQTAAVMHQSADNNPLKIVCDQRASFFQLVQDMARACSPPKVRFERRKRKEAVSLGLPIFGYSTGMDLETGIIPEINTINEAINVLRYICSLHSREPIVIIDEFDQLPSAEDKKYFADLIQGVSNGEVNLRFIFCGIGSSLEDLIGAHLSTGRYISPIHLEPLSHDARWEIIQSASQALGVEVDHETTLRIGLISDGFPYYVHLIGERLFWAVFDDEQQVSRCGLAHFDRGVKDALAEAQTSLRLAYDKATQKYSNDYEEVLWATADGTLLRRQISDIYENSYLRIMARRPSRTPLSKNTFNQRIYNLTRDGYGQILVGKGAGWYEFRENVIRGYVRLRAEERGIRLGIDHHSA